MTNTAHNVTLPDAEISTATPETSMKKGIFSSSNHLLGASFIVAGTAIGAGMLALPLTGAPLGPLFSCLLIAGLWAFMYYTSLVTMEVNTASAGSHSLGYLLSVYWGKWWGKSVYVVLGVLFYALLAAYITSSTSILHSLKMLPFSKEILSVLVTVILGGLVVSGMEWLDLGNRIFFLAMAAIFCGIIAILAPAMSLEKLAEIPQNIPTTAWVIAIPAFFTSFGFHGSIPSVMAYTTQKECRSSFLIGSFLAFICYVLWVTSTLTSIGNQSFPAEVGPFTAMLSHAASNPFLEVGITAFSLLAIVTSFLGVGLGLFDLVQEKFKKRRLSALATFLPPLGFSLFYPEGFLIALTYAAIALCLLAVIIPAALALWMRSQDLSTTYKAPGGSLMIATTLFLGFLLLGLEVYHLWTV